MTPEQIKRLHAWAIREGVMILVVRCRHRGIVVMRFTFLCAGNSMGRQGAYIGGVCLN